MAFRPRTFVIAFLILLLLGVLVVIFPFLYDPDSIKALLLRQVEQQVGRKIEVGQTRLELFPRLRLELSRVVIRDRDPSRELFSARRVDLTLRAYSLLRQRVVGKQLMIEQPRLELRRNEKGQWNILAGAGAPSGEPSIENPLGLLMMVRETIITDGEIALVDEFRQDGIRAFSIRNLEAAVAVEQKGLHADVHISGTIPDGPHVTTFSLTGRVTDPKAAVTVALDDGARTVPALQFEGTAEAANIDIRQVAEFFGPRPVPSHVRGLVNLRGQVSLVPGMIGYDMVLSRMQAQVGRVSLTGQASVSGLMGAQPTFSLTFSSSPISLEEVLTHFSMQWLPAQLQKLIVEQQLGGTVEAVTATVSGSAAPEPRVSLTGEFRVKQGHVLVGRDRTPVQNFSGLVFIEPDRLRIVELSGLYGPLRVNAGKALVSSLESDPWLELDVTGEMGASELIDILAKTIKEAQVAGALANLREIKGETSLALHLGGPVKAPEDISLSRAEVVARDIWFRTPLLAERVVDFNGRFIYSKAGIEFDRLGGRLGRTQFEVQGAILLGEVASYQDLTMRLRGDIPQLVRLLPVALPSNLTLEGMVGMGVSLTGPVKTPRIKALLDLRDAEFMVPDIVRKPIGTSTTIEFEGELSKSAALSVERLELVLPPFRLATKGKIQLGRPFNIEATIVSGPVSISGLPQGMTIGPIKDGIFEISLDVKGRGPDWRAWHVNGWVALTDGLIAPKGFDQKITDLYLRLKLVRNGAEIKRLAFKINESDIRLSGVVKNWNRTPSISVDVESALLDLDLLIPKGKRSPVRDVLENAAATSRVVAIISVDRGFYKSLKFTDLSWRVSLRDGVLDMDRISGDTDDGQIAGRLVVHLPKEKPAEADATFRLSGIDVNKLLELAGDDRRILHGMLSATATVRGSEKDPRGLLHSLQGKVEFQIENGRLQKGTILPKIITILNLPTLLQGKVDLAKDGFPFDKVIGSFSMMQGIITEDRLVVDSPVMKLSIAGTYNVMDDNLDAVVVVSPLGSYSQFLKSIPLFGKLLAGERQGLDTAIFEVKGPLTDPDVRYLPIRSFATGLTGLAQLAFDMLRNTIMLPKELLVPESQKSSSETDRLSEQHGGPERFEPRSP